MSLFEENPKAIFDNIKNLLSIGAKDRHHAFHTPIFSNKDKKDLVNSRIIVLRKFNTDSLKLNFHTDFRSPKIVDLQKDNNSFFVFYDFKIKIQLRIKTN
jgi:pyridoxamine 5'-phosphate oxidase